jgi:hypothetical protein
MLAPTIDGCLARQYDDNQLQTLILLFEVFEHWLDLFDADGVFAKAWLANNWHAGIVADPLHLLREVATHTISWYSRVITPTVDRSP